MMTTTFPPPHRDDHAVGNQVARIHEPLGLFSVLRTGRHLSTEEIARRDVRQAVLPPATPNPKLNIFRLVEDTWQLILDHRHHC